MPVNPSATYTTDSRIPLGTTLLIMEANEGPWPVFMSWDCKFPFAHQYKLQLMCVLHTECGFYPLSLSQALHFCTKLWSVNQKIQALGGAIS